jgi:acyl dehydratase
MHLGGGEMVQLVAEEEVYVGLQRDPHEFDVTPEFVAYYSAATGDYHPWYTGDSPFGGPVAPALLRHSEVYLFPGWYLSSYGNLHAKQEWELYHPMMLGDHVIARCLITDRYSRRGRDYVVNEVTFSDRSGRVLSRGRTHQSFLRDPTPTTSVVIDKDREKSAERRFDIPLKGALEDLTPLVKPITQEMCDKFSGPIRNYHNDREEARKLGFPDIVVQGMMSVCFLSELLTRRFGAGWYCGGKMNVSLVNVVWGSDTVISRGLVRELAPEGSKQRAHLDVWCEKPDGTKVIVGKASALVA